MADTDIQSNHNDAGERTAAATRRATGAAAEAGLAAERRSFAAGAEAGKQGAEAAGQAAQDVMQASRQAMQQASDHASNLWRASLSPMTQLQSEFGRWIDQMWRQNSPARLQNASPFALALAPFTGQPLADLRETDTTLELRVELPGLKAEDVQLSLHGEALTVSGEKAEEVERGHGGYRVSERRFGRFERSFILSPEADRNRIDASFKDGLLKVTIAKTPGGAQAKRIPIKN